MQATRNWLGRCFASICVLLALATSHAQQPSRTDVFTAGTEGYFAFRIPSLVTTKQGTLLAFCEGRKTSFSDDGDNDLVVKRSSDNGRTWSGLQLVHEEGGDAVITIGNPCVVVDQSNGRVWLTMNRKNGRVLITDSNDDGRTWSPVRDITSQTSRPDWGWYALGPGVGIQLTRGPFAGRLVIPANHRTTTDRSGPSSAHVIFSDDHGQTWKLGGTVGPHTNECQVVETVASDGSPELLINMRNHWGRSGKRPDLVGQRVTSRSRDGGLTWSEPQFDAALTEPTCQASMIRYSTPPESRSRLLFANPASKTRREQMTVRLSHDEGRTWQVEKLVDPGPSAYCCLARLADGSVGLIYERDNYKRLTFTSFPLEWLTGGREP